MNIPMTHVMTERDFEQTKVRLEKIGADGSLAREIAFAFMKLMYHIEQATIPNQQPAYLTANLEQFYLNLQAVKDTFKFTTERVQAGLTWLREQGLADGYRDKDLAQLEQQAKDAINGRQASHASGNDS